MPIDPAPLSTADSVGTWLSHPRGGPLLRTLLAQGGQDERALQPVRLLPLGQLVAMSQGRFPQSVVDGLVARANDLDAPVPPDPAPPVGGAPGDAADRREPVSWQERLVADRFTGQTVIVTGAASGIGRATASRVAREGGHVVAADLSGDGLVALVAELEPQLSDSPGRLTTVTGDITRQEDVDGIIAAAGSRIDGLANVAGIPDDFAPLHEVTDAAWQRLFAVNVDGLFRLTRAVVPGMLAAGRGSIVNITSEAGLRGAAAGTAYTAAKHAVVGLTRSAAHMYGPSGLRVNAVAPGGVATGIQPGTPNAFGRERLAGHLALIPPIALPEHLAASIAFLLSDDGVNVNGAVLPSDGGWSVQ